MSIQTRARRVAKATMNSYEQTLNELRRLRLRPAQDTEYIEVLNARYRDERNCESCGTQFPVAVDKKGMEGMWNSPLCPACRLQGTHPCAVCRKDLLGPPLEDGADFCSECEEWLASKP